MSGRVCGCGEPLHYSDAGVEQTMEWIVEKLGETIDVTVGRRTFRIPRHYIGAHGLAAEEVPALALRYGWETA